MLEMSQVRGGEQVWAYLYLPSSQPMCWSLRQRMKMLCVEVCVQDTEVKRGTELSTDHHFGMSLIRWWGEEARQTSQAQANSEGHLGISS